MGGGGVGHTVVARTGHPAGKAFRQRVLHAALLKIINVCRLAGHQLAAHPQRTVGGNIAGFRANPDSVSGWSTGDVLARQVQDLFMNPRFRVYTSTDKVGTELCAALKNIIALCAGCCDGMGCGDNTKALLMTRGLAEMARLGVALGGKQETFAGLAGVGDLIVTCCSMHSRNRRCGILIGKGVEPKEAVKEIGAVVEGYYAAVTARTLAQKVGIEMPIAQAAYEVLYEGRDVHAVVTELMSRAKRSETEESSWT